MVKLPIPRLLLVCLISGLIKYLQIHYKGQQAQQVSKQVFEPQEWLQLYTCNETRSESSFNWPLLDKCNQDATNWRLRYVDEKIKSELHIKENSIDERLANIIYTASTIRWTNPDHFKFNSGSRAQDAADKVAVAGPQVDERNCSRHLRAMVDLLEDLESRVELKRKSHLFNMDLNEGHIRLARILDSFGRFRSGHLSSGRTLSVGSYEECSEGQLYFQSTGERVQTRFCWARLRADEHLDGSLRRHKKSKFHIQDNSLMVGVCLPDTCHSISFDQDNKRALQTLVDSQFRLPKSIYINETLELDSVFCLPDRGSEFSIPLAGRVLVVALVGWIGVAIYATLATEPILDAQSTQKQPKTWTRALNLVESWKDFAEIDRKTRPVGQQTVGLDALNVVKVVCCYCVVLGHSFFVSINYLEDPLTAGYIGETPDILMAISFWASYLVDVFYVLTGLIVSYISLGILTRGLQCIENSNWRCRAKYLGLFWFLSTLNRYLRLVPMFALFHWFKKFVFIYLGSGPLWDFGLNKDTPNGACRQEESWLVPLTFWSAFSPITTQCILQSWSISNDILFCILLPPLIILMHHLGAKWATCTAMGLSLVPMITYNWRLAFNMDAQLHYEIMDVGNSVELRMLTIASDLYTRPQHRLAGIGVGALGGYYLFTRFGGPNRDKNRATTQLPAWATSASWFMLALPFWGKLAMPSLVPIIAPYQSLVQFFMPVARLVYCMGSVVLMILMVTDWREAPIVRQVSGRLWRIVSKLNYIILLLHYDLLVTAHYSATNKPAEINTWTSIATATLVYLICLPVSVVLYVVFENPINKLVKNLI